MTQTQQPSKRARRRKRGEEPLPPYEGPDAAAPPLRWTRRFTPLGLGRRSVRLQIGAGRLAVVRTPAFGSERVVVEAPLEQFHSVAPSRSGRGLHLWHGERLFRLAGRSTAKADGGSSWTLGDDPVSAVIGLILLPFLLFSLIGLHTTSVASQRKNVATTLRWLAPVVGQPPPGVAVRPPLPGGWLTAGRWAVRLAVVGGLAAGVIALV